MAIHTIKLIKRDTIAKDTLEFTFEKPDSFHFQPGHYCGFTLPSLLASNPTQATRRFTLLSTPDENVIRITTRMTSSPYKKALDQLKTGDSVKIAGPSGQFLCHDDHDIPAVFIAGGIGITPFYSMIKQKTAEQSSQPLLLFYGNEHLESAAYLDDFFQFEKMNLDFTFVPTLTYPTEDWQGENGYITQTLLKKYIGDLFQPIYYICGSPSMVATLQELLLELDIPADRIKTEDFPGY